MKKQILILMVSAAILSTNPVFAMEQETSEDGHILIPKKIPATCRIDFTHNGSMSGIAQKLKWLTGYEDSQTKEEKSLFILNQTKYPKEPVNLELCDASLSQLQEILPFCANVVELKLTNSTYRSDLWPNVDFLKALTTSNTLSNLEYLCIQEHKNITDSGAQQIISDRTLPKLKHIHCEADDYPGFYDVDKGPKFYWLLSQHRPDIKLTYAANFEKYNRNEVLQAAEQNSTAAQEPFTDK